MGEIEQSFTLLWIFGFLSGFFFSEFNAAEHNRYHLIPIEFSGTLLCICLVLVLFITSRVLNLLTSIIPAQ